MTVNEAIQLLKEKGAQLRAPIELDGVSPMVFTCMFASNGVEPDALDALHITCPPDLLTFWTVAESARLFLDSTYGQWGLHLLEPSEAVEMTRIFAEERRREFCKGDLVVGRFLGDSDLLIVRCSEDEADFGKVLVAVPLDPRNDWYNVANSFAEFLENYIAAKGDKFWENNLRTQRGRDPA